MHKAKKCDIMGCVTKNIAANIFRECKMTAGAALQTEKRRGGCAYESLAERKTKDAAQRSNTQFEGYVPAAWNSGFSGPDGACCLPALGRLGKPQAGR